VPPIFAEIQRVGEVDDAEMAGTFNLGVGMVLVVDDATADEVVAALHEEGLTAHPAGSVRAARR